MKFKPDRGMNKRTHTKCISCGEDVSYKKFVSISFHETNLGSALDTSKGIWCRECFSKIKDNGKQNT